MAKKATARKTSVRKTTPAAPPAPPAQTTRPFPWQTIRTTILGVLLAILLVATIIAAVKQSQAYDSVVTAQTRQQVAPTAEAPASGPVGNDIKAPPESSLPQIDPKHINGNIAFNLVPGASVNGGDVWVNGLRYPNVTDRVIVVTNNSSHTVVISSTDGVGWENNSTFEYEVKKEFLEGCDGNGCGEVVWVNVTNDGIVAKLIDREAQTVVQAAAATPTIAPTLAPQATPAQAPKPATKCPEGATEKQFNLPSGCSANGGILSLGATRYTSKDGQIVVIRNNSGKAIQVSTESGAGYDQGSDISVAKNKLKAGGGCSSTGCASVRDIEVKPDGSVTDNTYAQ